MKSLARTAVLGAALLALFFLAGGCGREKSTGSEDILTPENQTVDLNAENGGFLAVDEAPAFGDADLATETTLEENPADGYAGLSIRQRERIESLERGRPLHYALTVIWGDLRNGDAGSLNPPEQGDAVVWDGSMVLSAGAVRLLNLIDFERPEDRILPRATPEELAWASITHGDQDGLRALLIVPRADTTGSAAPPETLRFKAGDYRRDFAVADLEGLNEVVSLTDTEQISFRAVRADPAVSTRGFLRGHWGRAAEDSVGRFQGLWTRSDGKMAGVLRGHYGRNARGESVFFGKYIDLAGRFRGFLRGTWEATAEGGEGTPGFRESGSFSGRWVDEKGLPLGELNGRWMRRGNHTGVFSGAWQALVP
jgi:hypothetical protein